MSDSSNDFDAVSDELIEVLADNRRTPTERTRATQQLYQRHASWVVQQIGKKIFNPDDAQAIAQYVWMLVLQPEKLGKDYTNKNGKFRAYLRAPIRWAILKHIDKLPFAIGETGEKTPVHFTDVNESLLEESLDKNLLEEVIENIIKPNLKSVDIKSRNVYVVNEFETIFETDPSLSEVAAINGIADSEATRLLETGNQKSVTDCTDEEASVYLPINYRSLVDPDQVQKSSGRYFANLIGVSEASFRKRLHGARKYLLEIVRQSLQNITGDITHG